jgi:hypothetical protein
MCINFSGKFTSKDKGFIQYKTTTSNFHVITSNRHFSNVHSPFSCPCKVPSGWCQVTLQRPLV